ncbi:phospholipase A2 [Sporormia fimetaria CBS 119925]|uniref:Phospholipase A2 n=1 Tax=Sporormia fimetaria CBS 119925 TaxID=1340428 RepID=A0A6A6VG58_9PLEO|nr:phospholipase A2 [Sporormia fimetaria CBS 119925]
MIWRLLGRDLITTYHSLNPTTITELTSDPSPLEFMRHVSLNRPFIIRGGATTWPSYQKWTSTYLANTLTNTPVNVALTPQGNADSILPLPSHPTTHALFIKPHETHLPFTTVLHHIRTQHLSTPPGTKPLGPILYAQTQNDNLRNEYRTLFSDCPSSIPFARIALEKDPDAINLWIGNAFSTTALHKDNYENIYVQIRGRKHFTLLPPVESPCVNEKNVLSATYTPEKSEIPITTDAGDLDGVRLRPTVDEPRSYTPFCMWDPDVPDVNATRFSELSRPLKVTLDEGDMLYLPALWYHKVQQSCNEEGICVAVNYWYDLEFSGGFWSMANFVRAAGLVVGGEDDARIKSRGMNEE